MDGTYKTTKYAADKIALLGLFVAALLIARFIIASRSVIVLSGPIKLDCADLSVSMPVGSGWRSEKEWKYQENTFILSSVFALGSGNVTALARCRYLLAAVETAPLTRFKQKASAMDASIVKTGRFKVNIRDSNSAKSLQGQPSVFIDWVHITKHQILFEIFFGTIRLPNNHQFNIEVYQSTGDTDLAERVFKSVAESLRFEENRYLEAGNEVIARIKSAGLSSLLENQDRESFFLIKGNGLGGVAERTVGFTMDVFGLSGAGSSDVQDALNIQMANFYYIRDRYPQQHTAFFQSDNSFNRFVWKSQTGAATNRVGLSSTELTLDKSGVMTVKKFRKRMRQKVYWLSPAAIPDVFIDRLFGQMLESGHQKFILDVVGADGKIIPAIISRIEPEDVDAVEGAVYALKMELEDGRGLTQRFYFDSNKRVLKIFLERKDASRQVESIYVFDRASLKEVLRKFPEWADYILKMNKMFKQDQSGYEQLF